MRRAVVLFHFLILLPFPVTAETPPRIENRVGQLVIAIAAEWDSSRAQLRCFERPSARQPWKPVVFTEAIPVLLGRNGLAWGRGALPNPPWQAPKKREGDGRAPAGCFAIGKVYGYPKTLPPGSVYPYRQVTQWDAWIDDPKNPYYNRHFVADPRNVPPWFEKQRMRHGDAAYTYLVEIKHNASPPSPGAGSAIFFHIRRGPSRVTAGCTTMARPNLEKLIQWLRAKRNPHYVLLPKATYTRLAPVWHLPAWVPPKKP